MDDHLEFFGTYQNGAHRFAVEIQIPGQCEWTNRIQGWPVIPHPGTMNVNIAADGFPKSFVARFGAKSVKHLDSRLFRSVAEIPAHAIGGNTLPPTIDRPDRGNGQVWRARITKVASQQSRDCWLFRRIGSGYSTVLEFVSSESLSAALVLSPGDPIATVIYGTWVPS